MALPDTYSEWVADGRPWKLARPVDEVVTVLRRYGYTVYTLGDTRHLKKTACATCAAGSGAEDHSPYSHTGWPVRSPYPYVHAFDIMPPSAASRLPSLARLGAQLYADRQSGIADWIKYMNWEPNGPDGTCVHDSWQPDHARVRSTDRGHIHVSVRSDWTTRTAGGYDPVARLRGGDDVAVTADEIARAVVAELARSRFASPNGRDSYSWGGFINDTVRAARAVNETKMPALTATIGAIQLQLGQLLGRDFTDEDAIANAVLAGLRDREVSDIVALLTGILPPEKARAVGEQLINTVQQ